jgi:hypothetical protein
MSLSVLSQASALNPGSDLWIVPDLERSRWTAKLDWYLNFQICKSSRHQTAPLSEFVQEVLAETEQTAPQLSLEGPSSLMIASPELLPNKWVLVVPWTENMSAWTASIFKIWSGLQEPSVRIFLPPGQSAGSLQQHWQKHHTFQDFTVVLD